MLENVKIKGIHSTRYIMSWVKSGGVLRTTGEGYYKFGQWLKGLGLSNEEKDTVLEIASNGKMELEVDAKIFCENNGTARPQLELEG